MFAWITRRVRDAIMAGVQQAVDQLAAPQTDTLDLPEPIRIRLPGAIEEEPEKPVARQKGRAS